MAKIRWKKLSQVVTRKRIYYLRNTADTEKM